MTTLAFDTHKAVKALRAAGADEPLTEAVAATVGDFSFNQSNVDGTRLFFRNRGDSYLATCQ